MEDTDTQPLGRSLDRFEQSLKRLNPPAWIRQQSPLPPYAGRQEPGQSSTSRTRPRYSDHRRSYSAQRNGEGTHPSASNSSFWRTTATNSSREPSPGPGSRPATAGGRFQSSTFSRWSASTLCSDGQLSNGDNTPTDSVISAFSMRSSVLGAEPPSYPAPILTPRPPSSAMHHLLPKRPYLGWRSTDSLNAKGDSDDRTSTSAFMTPAERLALSYRRAVASPLPFSSSSRNGHALREGQRPASRLAKAVESNFVHDSIKSVSTAIMEFCQAEEVPPPPPASTRHAKAAGNAPLEPEMRPRRKEPRMQIIWLESSFVSSRPMPLTLEVNAKEVNEDEKENMSSSSQL